MFLNASRVLIIAAAAFAVTGTASAQKAHRPYVPPQKAIATAPQMAPVACGCRYVFAYRQDLFDRNDMNNLRGDWPGPPAQPAQF
ncbi:MULTISPECIES: hypothetical protein [Bradyrhizobium]|uniref:hypothetical protein n=1 Tax=Bradyrhizobium TaxID=374 RepID=UPI0008835B41|nr:MULTISPECIES: hypothetical protein [Bradyrhizobium]SDI26844.1 hypothetical protein SAMN05216338_1019141 [Bradyrhizobium sp. Rc2d]